MSNERKTTQGSKGPMGGGPMGGMGSGEKAKNFKGTMKNLLKYLKPFRISIILVVIFAIMQVFLNF